MAELMRSTIELRFTANSWDGPHFRPFSCGVNYFQSTPRPHAMFMDAMEPQGCWEYVLSGEIQYRLGESKYKVAAGEALVTRRPDPGWMLRPVKDQIVRTLWITVTGELALNMFDFLHHRFGQVQTFTSDSQTVRLARQLIYLAAQEKHRSAHIWSRKTFEWLSTWWEEAEAERSRQVPGRLNASNPSRLISYKPRTFKEFASAMGYSRGYLTRKLTQQWLRSPGKILRETRIQEAAKLLRTTRLSVGEIAARVGYMSNAGFCRAFNRAYRQTPLAYRRSHLA